jgi:hypothetical protein
MIRLASDVPAADLRGRRIVQLNPKAKGPEISKALVRARVFGATHYRYHADGTIYDVAGSTDYEMNSGDSRYAALRYN